jgi:hypothetical protein
MVSSQEDSVMQHGSIPPKEISSFCKSVFTKQVSSDCQCSEKLWIHALHYSSSLPALSCTEVKLYSCRQKYKKYLLFFIFKFICILFDRHLDEIRLSEFVHQQVRHTLHLQLLQTLCARHWRSNKVCSTDDDMPKMPI